MKILITVDSYYPDKNGVQNVTQYQAEGLVDLGHEVTVIASNNHGKYLNFEKYNGVDIFRVDAYNKNMFHFGNKKQYKRLVIEKANQCDVMMNVCLQSFAADWILPILSEIECKKILMLHSMHDFTWNKNDFKTQRLFLKKLLRNIRWREFYFTQWKYIIQYDKVIHLHEKDYSYSFFSKRNFHRNTVIYNSVEDKFFEEHKKENIIINVASFNSRKNQMLALECFYEANTIDFKLVLIGLPENDYYHNLIQRKKELDQKYGEKKVEIHANLDREQTVKYIYMSKIYLLTSIWEGFPISLVEAMASGAAYVSTNVGIVRYLQGGYVVDSRREMITALEKMIAGDWKKLSIIAKKYANDNMRRSSMIRKLEKEMCYDEANNKKC